MIQFKRQLSAPCDSNGINSISTFTKLTTGFHKSCHSCDNFSSQSKSMSVDIGFEKHDVIKNFDDYIFDPLERIENFVFEKYVGPTPESNWVIPGKLLVGAYPASRDDNETFQLLSSLLQYGINEFVCLQQEYQPFVTDHMWRNGAALRPYFDDVKLILKNQHKFQIFQDKEVSKRLPTLDKLAFVHFPIRDCSITDDDSVLEFAQSLCHDLASGNIIYLHCWGGHGRTGTIVSIMLGIMYKLNAHEAMLRCQKVHDMREFPVDVGSPQTQQQRDQVVRIINKIEEYRSGLTDVDACSLNEIDYTSVASSNDMRDSIECHVDSNSSVGRNNIDTSNSEVSHSAFRTVETTSADSSASQRTSDGKLCDKNNIANLSDIVIPSHGKSDKDKSGIEGIFRFLKRSPTV